MPDEDGDEDGNENDNDDAERGRAATRTAVVHYNRTICHTSSCSFRRVPLARESPGYTHSRQARSPVCRMLPYMWAAAGLVLSLGTSLFALYRSTRTLSHYYEADVYGMTPVLHRRYAAVSLLFAGAFALSFFVRAIPDVPVLGGFAVLFIFYFSTYLRGFSDEE